MEFSEEILQAALEGLLLKKERIEAQMELVRSLLNKQPHAGTAAEMTLSSSKPAAKRVMSPEARQRIIDAQKRRWALHRRDSAGKSVS